MRYLEQVKTVDTRRGRTEIPPRERRGLLQAVLGEIECNGCEPICQKGVVIILV